MESRYLGSWPDQEIPTKREWHPLKGTYKGYRMNHFLDHLAFRKGSNGPLAVPSQGRHFHGFAHLDRKRGDTPKKLTLVAGSSISELIDGPAEVVA